MVQLGRGQAVGKRNSRQKTPSAPPQFSIAVDVRTPVVCHERAGARSVPISKLNLSTVAPFLTAPAALISISYLSLAELQIT